jgi:hypothetical protein
MYYPGISLDELTKLLKTSVTLTGVPDEILNGHTLNTNQDFPYLTGFLAYKDKFR